MNCTEEKAQPRKSGKKGRGDASPKGCEGRAECEQRGTTESRECQNEAIMSDTAVENDFGGQQRSKNGKGGSKGRKRWREMPVPRHISVRGTPTFPEKDSEKGQWSHGKGMVEGKEGTPADGGGSKDEDHGGNATECSARGKKAENPCEEEWCDGKCRPEEKASGIAEGIIAA